jgi:hypothetical protein
MESLAATVCADWLLLPPSSLSRHASTSRSVDGQEVLPGKAMELKDGAP